MQGLTCSFLWILELLFDTELCKLRRALYNLSTQLCFSSFRQLPLCEVVPIQIHGTSVSQYRKHDFHLLPLPFVGPFVRLFQNITDFVGLEFFQVVHRYYRNSKVCYFVFLNLFIYSSRAIVVQLFLQEGHIRLDRGPRVLFCDERRIFELCHDFMVLGILLLTAVRRLEPLRCLQEHRVEARPLAEVVACLEAAIGHTCAGMPRPLLVVLRSGVCLVPLLIVLQLRRM